MVEWWRQLLTGPIPTSMAVSSGFVLLAALLTPAGAPPESRFYDTRGALSAAGAANVTTATVGASESASVHHLRVVNGVKTHFHRHHDETVTLLAGRGRMRLGAETREITAGTVILIPRGTPHSLEVLDGPVEAVSTFSPPFDGEDRIFVDD